jgi:hypothetical protein
LFAQLAKQPVAHYLAQMVFQVRIEAEGFGPLPGFADLEQAIAKGLLAQLPDDADPLTAVIVTDTQGRTAFQYTLAAWRWTVIAIKDKAYLDRPGRFSGGG